MWWNDLGVYSGRSEEYRLDVPVRKIGDISDMIDDG